MRFDLCQDNQLGLYLDGKWMAAGSIKVTPSALTDQEEIYEMGSAVPVLVARPKESVYQVEIVTWAVRPDDRTVLTFEGSDLEVYFWARNVDYQMQRETYIIEELEP